MLNSGIGVLCEVGNPKGIDIPQTNTEWLCESKYVRFLSCLVSLSSLFFRFYKAMILVLPVFV
jgi:hypothetical protein